MSRHHARTFSEFFKIQQSKIPETPDSPKPKRPDLNFSETPREIRGWAEVQEAEELTRDFKAFIRSHRGGSRTVAPAPQPIGKVRNFSVFHEAPANTEMKPRTHVAKPKPTALEIEAEAEARDKAKALALARTHAKALREAADAAEARLAAMES